MSIWACFTCPVRWRGHEVRTPRVHPNGHTFGVRCLVTSNIKQTRRGGVPLLIASNKVKKTRRGGFPLFVVSSELKQTRQGGVSPPRRVVWNESVIPLHLALAREGWRVGR